MRILLFGKNGQVGWELQRSLAPLGELIALDRHSQDYAGDLSNLLALSTTIQQVKPDIIVNAAAYTAVDKAESEPQLANLINTEAVAVMAEQALQIGALLVHYSTDYVFDGSGNQARLEEDSVKPLNAYGASKLAAEIAIQQSGCEYLIFRTSWVYSQRGYNFAKTMLRLAAERDSLSVIDDQIGAPTGADLLADITAHVLRSVQSSTELTGVYHLVASGETSWHGFARFVIEHAEAQGIALKVSSDAIIAVPSSEFTTAAERPKNSRLSTHKLQQNFALTLLDWKTGVSRMLTEFLEK